MKGALILLLNFIALWSEISAGSNKITGRVVGGNDAAIGEAPFQIGIVGRFGHSCGGAILNERFILTAAHCVTGFLTRVNAIIAGTNDLNNPGAIYYPETLILHPSYNKPLQYMNDIALIKVNETIKFTEKVQTIKLNPNFIDEGTVSRAVGWGSMKAWTESTNILQAINLTVISNDKCKQMHGRNAWMVDQGHICTFNKKGEGMCSGDSGGALYTFNENGEPELIGITNWAIRCATGVPDAFGRVSFFYRWITKTMEANS